MAADHCRAQSASVRKKRDDADCRPGAGGSTTLPRNSRNATANVSQLVDREPETTMSSRDSILAAVRANAPKRIGAPAAIPRFERYPASLVADFEEAAVRMGSKVAHCAQ